jgi:hypothetical protein
LEPRPARRVPSPSSSSRSDAMAGRRPISDARAPAPHPGRAWWWR